MAKITRVFQNIFCGSASTGNVGQFGSLAAGTPTTTTNISTIQALAAWLSGFTSETVAGNVVALEDLNGIFLVAFYQICYLLEMGIPEYDASTTYYTNSIVQYQGVVYQSTIDSNIGNTPSATSSQWGNSIGSPSGAIQMYAGSTPPGGWLLCNGQQVSRTTYANLYTVCSTTYGAGDGSTTFNVPDLRTRVGVGYSSGDSNFGALGNNGGEVSHTLTVNEIPSHSHTIDMRNANGYGFVVQNSDTQGGATYVQTESTGGGLAHNNLQPYLTINYIIKT